MKVNVQFHTVLSHVKHHLQNLNYGKTFVEQRTTTTNYTLFKFSAKEKDSETGYSYFGARYYDSDLSVFISVARYASKYPNLSSYQYYEWNPVNIIDVNWVSTRYYYKGTLLFTAYDKLNNDVVDLSHLDISDTQVKIIQTKTK